MSNSDDLDALQIYGAFVVKETWFHSHVLKRDLFLNFALLKICTVRVNIVGQLLWQCVFFLKYNLRSLLYLHFRWRSNYQEGLGDINRFNTTAFCPCSKPEPTFLTSHFVVPFDVFSELRWEVTAVDIGAMIVHHC